MELNNPVVVEQVRQSSDRYETALADNDTRTLDTLFWGGPEAVRYGIGENLYGAQDIATFRLARTGGSPQRRILRRVIVTTGTDNAVVSLEFQRQNTTRIGRQMQTWIRTHDGWKILAAHVSLMAAHPETEQPAL